MRSDRQDLLRQGIRLEYLTIGWNSLEAVVAVAAGWVAGSIALIGFGLDSVVEVAAGGMLLWRLRAEAVGGDGEAAERAERRALRVVGFTFFALAAYILYESAGKLWRRDEPGESLPGLILAALSLIAMPLLAHAKYRTARALGSRALAADATETAVCSYLSLTLLLGLGLHALWGWWWADPAAALAMLPLIVREGWEAFAGGCTHEELATRTP